MKAVAECLGVAQILQYADRGRWHIGIFKTSLLRKLPVPNIRNCNDGCKTTCGAEIWGLEPWRSEGTCTPVWTHLQRPANPWLSGHPRPYPSTWDSAEPYFYGNSVPCKASSTDICFLPLLETAQTSPRCNKHNIPYSCKLGWKRCFWSGNR